MNELTYMQGSIRTFIQAFILDKGYPPTRKEIATHFRFRSPNAAQCHLEALASKGAIEIVPGIARGIRLV